MEISFNNVFQIFLHVITPFDAIKFNKSRYIYLQTNGVFRWPQLTWLLLQPAPFWKITKRIFSAQISWIMPVKKGSWPHIYAFQGIEKSNMDIRKFFVRMIAAIFAESTESTAARTTWCFRYQRRQHERPQKFRVKIKFSFISYTSGV